MGREREDGGRRRERGVGEGSRAFYNYPVPCRANWALLN